MIKKIPSVYIQEVDLGSGFSGDNFMPGDKEIQNELHRRLRKFAGKINDDATRAAICRECEKLNHELLSKYPGYFGQFGYDVGWKNEKIWIMPYAKNIRTLLATMGYMMYALDCLEDTEKYSCPIGDFIVADGRAYKVEKGEEENGKA